MRTVFFKKSLLLLVNIRLSLLLFFKISRIFSRIQRKSFLWKPLNSELSDYLNLWSKYKAFGIKRWLIVYGSVSGIRSAKYVPENIYYSEIEPRLNNKIYSKPYTSKNSYHLFLNSDILPEVILRSINGIFFNSAFVNRGRSFNAEFWKNELGTGKYVIKPSVDSGGGRDVRILEISSEGISITPVLPGISSLQDIIRYYKRDFVIQRYIEQHPFFAQFNNSSLNTIRILTYRSLHDESIHILHRILRMGRSGSIVDNQASGGIACGIKSDGTLSEFGVDKYGNKYYALNGMSFSSVGKLMFLDEMCYQAIKVAGKYYYSRLLGLDFAVDHTGKVFLIEVNDSNNEINFYQMNNGPLFGDFTSEILEMAIHEPRSFTIDYYLD